MIERAPDGYFHPTCEADIQALVEHARATQKTLRVRGAGHSHPPAIFAGPHVTDAVELMLDRHDALRFDDPTMQVTASAGVHLGLDPRDPTGRSTLAGSLNAQLAARGWALPDLGGISHQTVAGFLATGSAGGSLHHNLADAVVRLRLVDGTGAIQVFEGDALAGALVSLGLLGVVTEVTLQCEPSFDIVGEESVRGLADAEIDLFAEGPSGLAAAFVASEYIRVLWWPQPGVERLVTWRARRMQPADYDSESGPPGALRRVPYEPFSEVLGSGLPMQAAAGLALAAIGSWPARAARNATLRALSEAALAPVYRAFVPVDTTGPQRFRDTWWQGLPMDDVMEERLMPVVFLEAWLPLARAAEAMQRLRAHVQAGGHAASGSFVIELYPGAPSRAWLSPGHGGEPSLRVNVFCLEHIAADVRDAFFAGIVNVLDDMGSRLHWGKHLAGPQLDRFPRAPDFLALRARLDPDGVFLSDYWKAQLMGGEAPRFTRREQRTARFPLIFRLREPGPDFAATARHHFINRVSCVTSPAETFDVFAHDLDGHLWIADLHDLGMPSGRLAGVGEVSDINYHYMSVRVRYTAYEPGRRLAAVVDAWSLPLCERMSYEARFEPRADGGTELTWDIAYEPLPAFRRFAPLVRPLFARLFAKTTAGLARYLAQRAGR